MIQTWHDGHLTVIAEAQLAGAGGDFALQRRAGRIRDQVARAVTADIDLCVIAQIINIELLTVFQIKVGGRCAAADGNLSGRRRRYRAGHVGVPQLDVVRGDRAARRGSRQDGLVGGNANAAEAAVVNALNGGVCRDDLLEVLDRANGRVRHGQGIRVSAANSHTGQVTVCKRILTRPVPVEGIIRLRFLYSDIFHVIQFTQIACLFDHGISDRFSAYIEAVAVDVDRMILVRTVDLDIIGDRTDQRAAGDGEFTGGNHYGSHSVYHK